MTKKLIAAFVVILLIGIGVVAYLFFKPPESASGPIEAIPIMVEVKESTRTDTVDDAVPQPDTADVAAESGAEIETEADETTVQETEPGAKTGVQADSIEETDPSVELETQAETEAATEADAESSVAIDKEAESSRAKETSEDTAASPIIFEIVPADSEARFLIDEVLRGSPNTVIGATDQVAGQFAVDPNDLSTVQVGIMQVNARTLATDHSLRNRAIRNFILLTDAYEFVTFTPTEVVGLPERGAVGQTYTFQLMGDLVVTDVTRPVIFDVTATPISDSQIEGTATTAFLYTDFELFIPDSPSVDTVDDEVRLQIHFVAEALTPTPTPESEETAQALLLGTPMLQEYSIPPGSRPHDVAPAPDGTVWYTAQGSGELGRLDPNTGETWHIALGAGSAPHGVIVGPDGAPWITDGGLNAIVRVDPVSEEVQRFPLPAPTGSANLNTATFDRVGVLWFTGQNGIYGRLDPAIGQAEVFEAPQGRGPYGISTAPDGTVYYASLAGSHIARVDLESASATVLEPPTPGQGARRVWPDSQGRIWVSEWNAGQVALYDPATTEWREWRLPGDNPSAYAVYVDEWDMVWLSDFGANALLRFDPVEETFEVFELPSAGANVRQILGRPGEVWGAESGTDKLVVIRTG